MPEVRQEVIIATAVILSALVTFIGFQTLYPETRKRVFAPQKPTKSAETAEAKPADTKKSAPHKDNLPREKFAGKILEK